jgi:2',3'-cyclic-nucleotide 2'-phosphodiesterase (5'-nucleotidase family)
MLLGRGQVGGPPADGRTFAHYMGLVDQQRRRPNAGASLVVGNGDDLNDELPVPAVLGGGGPIATRGRHAVEVFNAAGLDANTFGYNELDFVPDRLGEQVARSRFRWVSANVRDGSRPIEVFAARQGAQRWTLERVAGAQLVVVLSHLFYEEMEQVAEQVDGVDVLVGSHHGPEPAGYLEEPRVVRSTILSIAGHDMAAVGQLDLVVHRSDRRVVRHAFQRHVPTPQGPVFPAVKAVLDRYLADR